MALGTLYYPDMPHILSTTKGDYMYGNGKESGSYSDMV